MICHYFPQNQYRRESTDIHQTLQLMKLYHPSHHQPKKNHLWSALMMGMIQYLHQIVSECCNREIKYGHNNKLFLLKTSASKCMQVQKTTINLIPIHGISWYIGPIEI